MLGLVYKGLHELIVTKYGEQAWSDVKAKAELTQSAFFSFEAYPDDLLYKLLQVASEVMVCETAHSWYVTQAHRRIQGMSSDALLEQLGESWVTFTNHIGYKKMWHMLVSWSCLASWMNLAM